MKSKGVTKPKLESRESISSYLLKNLCYQGDVIFIAKDTIRFFQLINLIKGFPSADFFNSKGELIEYSATGDCIGKAEIFASALATGRNYKIDSSYHLTDIIEKVSNINENIDSIEKGYDFTILLYWAKYFGKLNKSLFEVLKTVRENTAIHPKIYLINMDFQSDWGLRKVPDINFK